MTKKELEQRVKELEQERDIWRDMMSKFIKALPIINPPVVFPLPSPAPQTWPPFVQPTPYTPFSHPRDVYITTCTSPLLKDMMGGAEFVYPLQVATN